MINISKDFPDEVQAGNSYSFEVVLENASAENISYYYKLELYLNGSLYTKKGKTYLNSGEKIVISDSFTQPQQGSSWEIKAYMEANNTWIDETETVDVSLPESCSVSDLSVNWNDRKYGSGYDYDAPCPLPEGYKGVLVKYSEGAISINKTSYEGENNKPPEKTCTEIVDGWKNGYIESRTFCDKDGYWYWVRYPVELISEEPSLNVTKLYVYPEEVTEGDTAQAKGRFDLTESNTNVEIACKPEWRRSTLTKEDSFDVGIHEINLDIPTKDGLGGDSYNLDIRLYYEVNGTMKEADRNTVSFKVIEPEPELDVSKIYFSRLQAEKTEIYTNDKQTISGRVYNGNDTGINAEIRVNLFNQTYKTTINVPVQGNTAFDVEFNIPDLGLNKGESTNVSGTVEVFVEEA